MTLLTCARMHRTFASLVLLSLTPAITQAGIFGQCRAPLDSTTLQKLFDKYVPAGSNGRAPAAAFYHMDPQGEFKVDLFSSSEKTKQAVASTQKIMTAWIAVKNGSLSKKTPFTSVDLSYDREGNRAVNPTTGKTVQVGESPKLGELLYTLLYQSSNGAAQAISRGVGGTTQKFMHWVNQEVPELLSHYDVQSYFQNPHGLTDTDAHYQFADPAQKQLSTADNMARFIGKIMAQSGFRSALKTINFPGVGDGILFKNGSTQAAGKTIVGRLPFRNSNCSGHALAFALFGSKAENQFDQYNALIQQLYAKMYGIRSQGRINAVADALGLLIQNQE